MTVTNAKGRLDQGGGEPSTGYVTPSDIQTAFDDLESAWTTADTATERVLYWPGASGVGTWPARPGVLAASAQVEWRSVLDALAPPPPTAVVGDSWKRAPGAVA